MTPTLALLSLILGTVYTTYGVLTAIDLKRGWRSMGFSHFGAAWIAMAFTCGPHHLEHGLHLSFAGRSAGWIELMTVAVGLPAGAVWVLLRLEAINGGRGDRFISGTPAWLHWTPTASALYTTLFVALGVSTIVAGGSFRPVMAPNILLTVLYVMIGLDLLRTQRRNRASLGGWSVSGVSLTAVFFTCASMHAAWVVYAFRGVYDVDVHGLVIDWLGVPAAIYFLWVVRSLSAGAGVDWNQPEPSITTPERVAA